MQIERKIVKSFRGEATVIFLIVTIVTYAVTSSFIYVLMTFIGLLIALLLLKPKNRIYILQLDRTGFYFLTNQQVKYQYRWSEVEAVIIEAEYQGWQYEVTLFTTNSSIGKTLPIYLTSQEANTLSIDATQWSEAKTKIEVRL